MTISPFPPEMGDGGMGLFFILSHDERVAKLLVMPVLLNYSIWRLVSHFASGKPLFFYLMLKEVYIKGKALEFLCQNLKRLRQTGFNNVLSLNN